MKKWKFRLYIPALLIIFGLALINQITTNAIIEKERFFGELLNKAGKQRMLSQRLIIEASNYLSNPSINNKKEYEYILALMEEDSKKIETMINRENSKQYYFSLNGLSKDTKNYLNLHKTFIEHPTSHGYQTLYSTGTFLLDNLDGAVEIHAFNYQCEINSLQKNELTETIFFFIALLAIWRFLFHPASRYIQETQVDLENKNIKLLEYLAQQTEYIKMKKHLEEAQTLAKFGTWVYSPEKDILELSNGAKEIFDLYIQDNTNLASIMNRIHPDDRKMLEDAYFTSVKEKRPYFLSYRLLMDDGSIKYIDASGTTEYTKEGTPIHTIGAIKDVTKNKVNEEKIIIVNNEIKKEKQRYEAIIRNASDGIFIMGFDGCLKEWNDMAAKMLGYDYDEMSNLCVFDWDVMIPHDELPKLMEGIGAEEAIQFETKHKRKDGSVYDVSITAIKIIINGEALLYASARDITEQKELENSIVAAKESAEKSDRSKSEFLANMSHEIRTPLNGVIGLNTLLLKTPLNNQQGEYVQKALKSSKALLGVINDILDYSKIEAGKLELSTHPFSLEDLLHTTTDLFNYSVQEKSLEMHIDLDPSIPSILEGDALRISQVFNNLVGNAVKFTPSGDITIKAKLLDTIDHYVRIQCSVQDTGIGMSEEELHKLFKAFSQTDTSNTRKYGGTGLGLVITKQLVEMMDGKIWVESTKDEGTTFSFTLLLNQTEYTKSDNAIETFKAKTFLVVEDNDIERDLIGKILESWDIHPILCGSGEEALRIAESTHIDYLLVDWQMPGLDGLDVIEGLKEHHSGAFPKVIMISALMSEELAKHAKKRNISPDKILHKPVTPSILLESIISQEDIHYPLLSNNPRPNMVNYAGKVLVAEDNELNRLIIRDLLSEFNLDVDIVTNGAEAIQMCMINNHYNLILMDLQMPCLDGFEAAKSIRSFAPTIPIIALSAAVMDKDKELTFEAGMNGHLAKPIDIDQLHEIVRRYLSKN